MGDAACRALLDPRIGYRLVAIALARFDGCFHPPGSQHWSETPTRPRLDCFHGHGRTDAHEAQPDLPPTFTNRMRQYVHAMDWNLLIFISPPRARRAGTLYGVSTLWFF